MNKIVQILILISLISIGNKCIANISKDTIIFFIQKDCCFGEGGNLYQTKLDNSIYSFDISASRTIDNYDENNFNLEILKDNLLFNKLNFLHYRLTDMGIIFENNDIYLFFVGLSGGTGVSNYQISILKVNEKEIISTIYSYYNTSIQAPFNAEYSPNFYLDVYSQERIILEKLTEVLHFTKTSDLKYDYDDSEFATDLWLLYNENIVDGKLEIKKYRLDSIMINNIYQTSSIIDILENENVKYVAYFKGGLKCYDLNKMEYYVLYFPGFFYNWPTVLRIYKNYIIIGTRGEGIAIINLNTFYIKRYNLDNLDVEDINFLESGIYVNNTINLPFPNF